MAEVGGFRRFGQGKADFSQPFDHFFLANFSIPSLASSVMRASALAWAPASMAASYVMPSMC
jgi:hypothetical protein